MEKAVNRLNWRIGGEAGFGILNAGMVFAKICLRAGLHTISVPEYPSLIRGGHNFLNVRVSDHPVHSHLRQTDLLVALNYETFEKHKDALSQGAAVIFDEEEEKIKEQMKGRPDVHLVRVPLLDIAKESGNQILRNTVAIAASLALVDFGLDIFLEVLTQTFSRKGDEVVKINHEAAKKGYDFVKKNHDRIDEFGFQLQKKEPINSILITGNESIAAGAIQAGCKLIAAYPMTPATSIMINIASQDINYDVVVKHTEDELAAMNMAIGANYAGVRAMCSTSGGGFSLMVESFGLAGVTETPLVVAEVMRPGPGTGMATHTGQGDLRFVLHCSTDEAPRIIITPGSAEECFYGTQMAFNLAEKYQMPVIILSDKFMAETHFCPEMYDTKRIPIERGRLMTQADAEKEKNYLRYKVEDDPVSRRALPGMPNCMHVASSYEHNEKGTEDEDEVNRIRMHDKRFRKLDMAVKEIPPPELDGSEDAEFVIIGWGSTKGPITEALSQLSGKGKKVAHLHLMFVSPLPIEEINKHYDGPAKVVVVENNKTGLLAGLIKEHNGKDPDFRINKYDGRPFFPEEIVKKMEEFTK